MNQTDKKPMNDSVSKFLKRIDHLPPDQRASAIRTAENLIKRAIAKEQELG